MIDNSNIRIIAHVWIRDPDSDVTILKQRDRQPVMEDYTSKSDGKYHGTKVETLPAGIDSIGSIDDLEYFNRKLITTMRVPLDYFGKVTPVHEEIAPENEPDVPGSDCNE